MHKNPCYKCTERYLGCHDKCTNYAQFKATLSSIKQQQANEAKLRPEGNPRQRGTALLFKDVSHRHR